MPRQLNGTRTCQLLLGVVLLGTLAAGAVPGHAAAPTGGTLRLGLVANGPLDPAVAFFDPIAWEELNASCATLLNYPPARLPKGYRLVPEAATGDPTVSRDARTFTFKLRSDLRFSDGTPLTARNFAYAINRVLSPGMRSRGAEFVADIVGADLVMQGTVRAASGVTVRGNTLTIRLRRGLGDLPARLSMPFFCPVPTDFPLDPQGVPPPFSGGGPYTIASTDVIVRNPLYRGPRQARLDRFEFVRANSSDELRRKVEAEEIDCCASVPPSLRESYRAKYGVNRGRYFVVPSRFVFFLALNTERPLFRDNAPLRRAIGFAVDRGELLRSVGPYGGVATDQYLSPDFPGFRDVQIYPLDRPDLVQARSLALGRLREGRALLYTCDVDPCVSLAAIVQKNLREIGLEVEIRTFPTPVLIAKLGTRGEPFDIGLLSRGLGLYRDPYSILRLFDGRTIRSEQNDNLTYFDSARFNRRLDEASRLTGPERYRALAALEIELERTDSPWIALFRPYQHLLMSSRVGCLVFNGRSFPLNLSALCVRE